MQLVCSRSQCNERGKHDVSETKHAAPIAVHGKRKLRTDDPKRRKPRADQSADAHRNRTSADRGRTPHAPQIIQDDGSGNADEVQHRHRFDESVQRVRADNQGRKIGGHPVIEDHPGVGAQPPDSEQRVRRFRSAPLRSKAIDKRYAHAKRLRPDQENSELHTG